MFAIYTDIFNARGFDYHQAMIEYPLARQEEFEQIIDLADIDDNQVVADIPSGGDYLSDFVNKNIQIISVETSREFYHNAKKRENDVTITCDDASEIPLLTESVDRVLSLSGSHHLPSKPAFYREVYRLLKNGGIFSLADVRKGSGVDRFLNIFVDQYNSMGHQGEFLNAKTKNELEAAGFTVTYTAPMCYQWNFTSVDNMIRFCKLLFGIDCADNSKIRAGIEHYLGYTVTKNQCCMNWELFFFKAVKQ